MITYLLNFILCSGLLLLVYRVFLQNESLYRFNRFYLLFSLVFAVVVPLVTIKVLPREVSFFAAQTIAQPGGEVNHVAPVNHGFVHQPVNEPIPQQNIVQFVPADITITPRKSSEPTVFTYQNMKLALFASYLLGTIGLLIRFGKNLYQINRTITLNPVIDRDNTSLVLIDGDVTPHSFLQYIFLDKKDYEAGVIEPEIICHEQTHVRQHHSLDVIFVELLQVVCWLNPFIPLYRKAVQLNHEFLADEAVIVNFENTLAYQHLLLAKVSQANSLYLTSQFNYLTTKKRLIMMTKTTSAKMAMVKRLTLVPILVGAVLLFSHKVIAQNTQNIKLSDQNAPTTIDVTSNTGTTSEKNAPQSLLNEYTAILTRNNLPYKEGEQINYTPKFSDSDRRRLEVLYDQMSNDQQIHQYVRYVRVFPPPAKLHPTDAQLAAWKDAGKYYIRLDEKAIKNSELSKFESADLALMHFGQLNDTKVKNYKFKYYVKLMTQPYYVRYYKNSKKYDLLVYIPKDKWNIWPIGTALKNDAPQSVLDEYAAILEKYKDINPHYGGKLNQKISSIDKNRLEALYKQMSEDQQQRQWLWFLPPRIPQPQSHPTDKMVAYWKEVNYEIYINSKRIANAELRKYTSADFDYCDVGRYSKSEAKNYRTEGVVDLMTKKYYAAYQKKVLADTNWYIMHIGKGMSKDLYRGYPAETYYFHDWEYDPNN